MSLEISASESDSQNINFAAGIAAYGLALRNSEYKGTASISMALDLVQGSLGEDRYGLRAQLVDLLKKASKIKGNQ